MNTLLVCVASSGLAVGLVFLVGKVGFARPLLAPIPVRARRDRRRR